MVNSDQRTALRQRIISEIRRLAASGNAPGQTRFVAETGITPYQILMFWPKWSDALTEAGYSPNKLQSVIPSDTLLELLADLALSLGHLPSSNEIRHASQTVAGFPYHSTFQRRFGDQGKTLNALAHWIAGKSKYSSLAATIEDRQSNATATEAAKEPQTGRFTMPLNDSIIPPVIESLPELANGNEHIVQYCRSIGKDENVEFERRVGIAFRIVGLSVEVLGQGSGRVADGIAKCFEGGWGIVYDAKIRAAGYKLMTEDRKFREYIERHGKRLSTEGISRLYFAVISSSFAASDIGKARELVRLTNAKSCVFVEAKAVLRIVERRLNDPLGFTLDDVERAFIETRILTAKNV